MVDEHAESNKIPPEATSSIADARMGGKMRNEINDELSNGIARSTLQLLEPLDQSLCRARPGCVWSRDCDKIYAFIRKHWDIPDSWPGEEEDQGPFDEGFEDLHRGESLEPHAAVPSSRVAAAMAKASDRRRAKQAHATNARNKRLPTGGKEAAAGVAP